jgi:surface polysaccharide O-acyltransferase-like enzyme
MSSTNVSISQRIVSVYVSHQLAISQQRYLVFYQDPIQVQTLILLSSALTLDLLPLLLPETPYNLSVCRHMIPDHVRMVE